VVAVAEVLTAVAAAAVVTDHLSAAKILAVVVQPKEFSPLN